MGLYGLLACAAVGIVHSKSGGRVGAKRRASPAVSSPIHPWPTVVLSAAQPYKQSVYRVVVKDDLKGDGATAKDWGWPGGTRTWSGGPP